MPEIQTAADRNTIRSAMRQTTGMYKDKATLLAETDALPEGEVFGCIEEGYSYEVAAAAATDHDETTAGGDKLYRVYPVSTDYRLVAEAAAPTATGSATAGNVTGTVYYTVTFVTADGETSGGNLSSSVTVTNKQVDLTNIPVSTDRRVTARKIYRTSDGAADPRNAQLLTTINDNTTTTYTDDTLDANLGADVPWINTTGGIFKDGTDVIMGIGPQFVGLGSGIGDGYACLAVGPSALASNTKGVRNIAVGQYALTGLTTGGTNNAIGVHSGESLTTGGGNVSIGYTALQSAVSINNNIVIGNYTAQNATTGDGAVYIGDQAGQLRSGGNYNIGIGYQSLRGGATSTGTDNVAIGRTAGSGNTTGHFNTVVGAQAQCGTTASGNTVVGFQSGNALTSGGANVFIGRYAGNFVTTESNNLFIDNTSRTDFATSKTLSLVWGVFSTTRANQQFHVNGRAFLNGGMQIPTKAITTDDTPDWSDHTINVTGTGTVTITLTNPANLPGKVFHFRNLAAFTVVSASANIVPLAGGAATTAILPATAGSWAMVQSNGSAWEIIAAG